LEGKNYYLFDKYSDCPKEDHLRWKNSTGLTAQEQKKPGSGNQTPGAGNRKARFLLLGAARQHEELRSSRFLSMPALFVEKSSQFQEAEDH
jgi:hypothetical protein